MFEIKRIASLPDGMFGVLLQDGVPFAVTLERPWVDNKVRVSCIPAGEYEIRRCSESPDYGFRPSPKFGDTFQVMKVPGRSLILFHKGNTIRDSQGCILVGENFAELSGAPSIGDSRGGYAEFIDRAGMGPHKLVVTEVFA